MNAWKVTTTALAALLGDSRRGGVLALILVAMFAGCTSERVVVRSGPACVGGVWIAGHYGPHGYWHPAHWRCPGVVEVVEVD
jgi:hypothetical protein